VPFKGVCWTAGRKEKGGRTQRLKSFSYTPEHRVKVEEYFQSFQAKRKDVVAARANNISPSSGREDAISKKNTALSI